MVDWRVRILHVSDLHEQGPREKESWRRRRVLGDAWLDNLKALLEDGPVDLVCFTGDLADWGKPEEYGPVGDFCQELLQKLGLGAERLFLVPGNHDIDWGVGKAAWEAVRQNAHRAPAVDFSRWLGGGAVPFGFAASWHADVLARGGAFRNWLASIGRGELLPAVSQHGHLGYRRTVQLARLPFPIQVIGLDSAWLAGDDHDEGKLRLTDGQVGALVHDPKGEALPGFKLGLIHHPLTALADESECRALLADNLHLLLRGHMHREVLETQVDPDHTFRLLAAGCLYEGHGIDRWPNACHVIDAVLDEAGQPKCFDVRFRSWSPRGHWFDDNGLYSGTKNGRLSWWIQPASALAPVPPGPAGPFIGREDDLKAIEEGLSSSQPRPVAICAVQGMPGIGKTYLAQRVIELNGQKFPGGVVRLVLDRRRSYGDTQLLGDIVEQLRLPAATVQRPAEVRERLLQPPTLLLLENVDSAELARVVATLLSVLGRCPALVTGRFQGIGATRGWTQVPLDVFDEPSSLALLSAEAGAPRDVADQTERRRLAHELGYLPLALHLAAGYLRVGGYTPAAFRKYLRVAQLNVPPADPADSSPTLRATFELSLDLLRQQLGPEGTRLVEAFAALGHLAPDGFGPEVAATTAGLSDTDFRRLIHQALTLSLVSVVPHQERPDEAWRIHPLLAELLRAKPEALQGHARLTAWLCVGFEIREPIAQKERWALIHQESASLFDWLSRLNGADLGRVAQAAFDYARLRGPFQMWISLYDRATKAAQDEPTQSSLLFRLAQLQLNSGLLDEAMAAATKSKSLASSQADARGEAIAASLQSDIFMARGELDKALHLLQQELLPAFSRLNDIRSRAAMLGKVAEILETRGEYDEALRIHREEELPVYANLGEERSCAITLDKMADIIQARGELDEALRIRREETLPAYERLGDVRSRAVTLGKVADILHARGQLDEALRIRRDEQLPVYEYLGDARGRAITLDKIADILESRGEIDTSLRIRRQDVLLALERLGDVRTRAGTLGKIADTLQARGQNDEAHQILTQDVLPIFERIGDIRQQAVTFGKIANILQARSQNEEALRTLVKNVLPTFERLGDIRQHTVTLGQVTDLLDVAGESEEALRVLQNEVIPAFEHLGDPLGCAVSRGKIAGIFVRRGRLDEALRLLQVEVLPALQRLGNVRFCAVTSGQLAEVLQARGELDEALRIRREEELPVYERLGDVRGRAVAMGKIADILQSSGKLDESLRIRREEEIPVHERLGNMRELIIAQANLARGLLVRGMPSDRKEAADLLAQAQSAADRLHLPEAEQIRLIQQESGLAIDKP